MLIAHRLIALATVCAAVCAARPAFADETDNFTCRLRALRESEAALDAVMNARIQLVLARVNSRDRRCDAECLVRELTASIGGAYRHPLTGIPHARFERWITRREDVDRCHVKFRESIYGARPYNQPWLWPFTGRVILLADSIRLADRVVGIDKVNHFIREGLEHWRAAQRPDLNIAAIMRKELGPPRRQFRWNEYGLKGWSLTGVLAYADLAASYSGYRFWSDLLALDRDGSFIERDAAGGFVQVRPFRFAAYVNDAWDESLNCSEFHATLAREVRTALANRAMSCPASPAGRLIDLPHAELYVNPRLLYRKTIAAPDVQ